MMANTWFITGCSTGLGLALAKYVLMQGGKVVGTVRTEGAMTNQLDPDQRSRTLELILDVTDLDAIEAVVQQAISWAGEIDYVVNNAGYGLVGAVEGMTMDQIIHQLDTNFIGAVAITKAFLPAFRAKGKGHFFHISSIAGLNASPGGSIYSASKFALEGFSEGLMKETSHLGIYSTLIEPGPFRTDWAGRSLVFAKNKLEAYDPSVGGMFNYLQRANGNQKGSPELAAQAIYEVAQAPLPPARLLLGEAAYRVAYQKLEELKAEFLQWEHLGKPTDYPQT